MVPRSKDTDGTLEIRIPLRQGSLVPLLQEATDPIYLSSWHSFPSSNYNKPTAVERPCWLDIWKYTPLTMVRGIEK